VVNIYCLFVLKSILRGKVYITFFVFKNTYEGNRPPREAAAHPLRPFIMCFDLFCRDPSRLVKRRHNSNNNNDNSRTADAQQRIYKLTKGIF
jgi:hypothetical protein